MSVKLFNFNLLNENLTTFKDENGNIYGKAKDIARMLGYEFPKDAIRKHVSNKYKFEYGSLFRGGEMTTSFSPVAIQDKTLFLSEPGIYELVFSSKLPQAILFRDFVFGEVLPALRETGQYQMINALEKIKNINLIDIENLTTQELWKYKKELNEKVDEVKIEYHVERGHRGGTKTWENIRKMKKENIELKEENEQLKRDIPKLQEQIVILFDLLDK